MATAAVALTCPGCSSSPMTAYGLSPTPSHPGGNPVHACERCGGVWVPALSLKVLVDAAASEASGTGESGSHHEVQRRRMASSQVVYRKCAECAQQMHRRNFGVVSGVIVDECRNHGTFFDAGELEDVLAFVRSGGLRLAAARQAEEAARNARPTPTIPVAGSAAAWDADEYRTFDPVSGFLRWATRWLVQR